MESEQNSKEISELKQKVNYIEEAVINLIKNNLYTEKKENNQEFCQEDFLNTEDYVAQILISLGCPINLNGFTYIKCLVANVVDANDNLKAVGKKWYQFVADQNHVAKISNIERGIRNAIEVIWKHRSYNNIDILSDYILIEKNRKPTNVEFLSILVEKVYQYKKKYQSYMLIINKEKDSQIESVRKDIKDVKDSNSIKLIDIMYSVELKNAQILHVLEKAEPNQYIKIINNQTLEKIGYEYWKDVLDANVIFITNNGDYGLVIKCKGAEAARFKFFRNMLKDIEHKLITTVGIVNSNT